MNLAGVRTSWKRRAAATGIAVFAGILLMTAGCAKDSPTSSPCDGFGGGNIVGKWRFRWPGDPIIYEYRADGTFKEPFGKDVIEGTYEVDGNEIRTTGRFQNSPGTTKGNQCFDVKGSVLRLRDKKAAKDTSDGYFDRI